MPNTGPISDQIEAALAEFGFWRDYRAGRLAPAAYLQALETHAAAVEARLGNSRHLRVLASRYPPDFDRHADQVFAQLQAAGLVGEAPPTGPLDDFRRRLQAEFDHGPNRTYIQPNEARLVALISMSHRPRLTVVLGSYYGYWAVWALPGIAAAQGRAILVDPNPTVCALAEKNLRTLGFADRVTVMAEKGEDVLPRLRDPIDLLLLDASGGGENKDPAYHGKGIYALLGEAAFAHLRDGALLVTHNDYLPGVGDNSLTHAFVAHGAQKLERFHAFCAKHFRRQYVADTPDGFGVYLK